MDHTVCHCATPYEVVHVVVVTSCLLLIRHNGLRARKAVVCCADAVRVADGQACASCVPAATPTQCEHSMRGPGLRHDGFRMTGHTCRSKCCLEKGAQPSGHWLPSRVKPPTARRRALGAPLSSGVKSAVNSRKLVSSWPSSSCGQLSRTDRMACVAQALLMTWLAKNTLAESELVSTGRSSFSWRHLNRKMRPYTGLCRQHVAIQGGVAVVCVAPSHVYACACRSCCCCCWMSRDELCATAPCFTKGTHATAASESRSREYSSSTCSEQAQPDALSHAVALWW